MDRKEWKLREEICEAGRRLYLAGFLAGSDGNLSVRLDSDQILITPSRLGKGYLNPLDIIKVDNQGQVISGDLPPSLELAMHLAAFEERPDIAAVIHSHPPFLIAFTIANQSLPTMVLPEIEVLFGGSIPIAPYATPGTRELGDSIRTILRQKETVLIVLDHHGTLAVGNDIFQAAMRTEHAENAAKIIFYAKQLGSIHPLPPAAAAGLKQTRSTLQSVERRVFSGGSVYENIPQTEPAHLPHIPSKEQEIEKIVQTVLSEIREMGRRGS